MTSANKLVSVVEHWLPRIEAAGIPHAMALDVITRAGEWSKWLPSWLDEADRHEVAGDDAEDHGWYLTAGEAYARASICAHFAQFMAFEYPQAKAAAAARKCALYIKAAPLFDFPAQRLSILFENAEMFGNLRRPAGVDKAPVVLIVPGSDSTKEEFFAFERFFLQRGLATFSLDGPGQGEGRVFGPLRSDIAPALDAAADVLRQQTGLSGRIGLVGMAFGGNLAVRAAATLDWPEAVVSINGFADLGSFADKLPAVYRDNLRYAFGVDDVISKAQEFNLSNAGPTCASLILHGGRDTIFPPGEASKMASLCKGTVDLKIFPEGNHVCNNIAWLYRPLVADWLHDKLSQ